MRLLISTALAVILASGCTVQVNTPSAPATASTTSTEAPPDDLMALLHGVPVAEPEARHLMEMVCTTFILHPGTPISAVARELSVRQSWTPVQADQFIRAAVAVSCPRFVNGS